jgi:two-component system cell cycle sensor histidine kinase/response regulator CckA
MNTPKRPFTLPIKTLLLVMIAAVIACGAWLYRVQDRSMRKDVEEQLLSIARLKVDQILAWRTERLEDGAKITQRPLLAQRMAQLLTHPLTQDPDLLAELRIIQHEGEYTNILLVDREGRVRLSTNGESTVPSDYLSALSRAMGEGKPVLFTSLNAEQDNPMPYLSVIAPIFSGTDQTPQILGAVILVSNPSRFISPLLRTWPTPSRSAEILLVRKAGDDVLFLSPLRHKADQATHLRISLNRADLPAAMAIQGHKGIVEGRDYRGIRVVAAIMPIPGSAWYLVAKMDANEAFAARRFRRALMLALLSSLAATAFVIILVAWQREKKNYYRELYRSEAALRVNAQRHSITLKAIGDAVIAVDAAGHVELLNPAAETLTGWRHEEARGKPLDEIFRIVDEQSRTEVENPVARVLREGMVVGLANHTVLIAKDGTQRPIADSGAPIRDEQGQITGVVLVFRDQSEERAYRKEIRDSEKKYRSLYNSIRDAIMVADINRRIIDCNPAFIDLFGYLPEEVIGQETLVLYENESAYRSIGKSIGAHRGDYSEFMVTINYKKKTGEIFPGETSVYFLRDDQGEFIGLIGLIRDVTRRRQDEAERERLMTAIEQTNEMVLITDAAGTIQYVNPAFETVTGYSRAEAIGQNPRILKSGEQDEAFYRELWQTISRGQTWEGRLVNRRKDGTLYTAEVTITPVVDPSGRIVNYVAAKRDITKHLKLADQLQQAQKMESIGRLAGGVAHDYNNMLSVIIGYADLAMDKVDPDTPLYADLEEIIKAARRSADITMQLLAFARRQTIAPKKINLNDSVEGTLKMLRRLIGEDIDLSWRPSAGLWPVKMDPAQVGQILANLCVNARDAIEGVGKITIETENSSFDETYCADHAGFTPGHYVMLAVSDSGCGMDKNTLNRVFEPFFTTKEMGQGTGLGLATVYGTVRQNNGVIDVYSEPGEGTTFKIYLPRDIDTADDLLKETRRLTPNGHGETILVVEDEISILNLTRLILESMGYHVLTATTPRQAIRMAENHTGDLHLLITDVVMPEMDGRQLTEQLMTLYPHLKHLYMSGYTSDVIAHRGILERSVHFIHKPFSRQELAAKVGAVLKSGVN